MIARLVGDLSAARLRFCLHLYRHLVDSSLIQLFQGFSYSPFELQLSFWFPILLCILPSFPSEMFCWSKVGDIGWGCFHGTKFDIFSLEKVCRCSGIRCTCQVWPEEVVTIRMEWIDKKEVTVSLDIHFGTPHHWYCTGLAGRMPLSAHVDC